MVDLYNEERPHTSKGNQTPTKIHHSKTKEKPEISGDPFLSETNFKIKIVCV
jgi:hypothetical protein